ncbi:MAG: polysaccharide deacetylase family protein [Aquihabitans sp.]
MVLLVAAATGAVTVFNAFSGRDYTVQVQVISGDIDETVQVGSDDPVAIALANAGVEPHDGVLLSARDGVPVSTGADPARITVDDLEAGPGFPLYDGAVLRVVDGTDSTEGTKEISEVVRTPEMPEMLRHVHERGAPGRIDRVVGEVSGEVISSDVIREARAPKRTDRKVVALTFDDGPNTTWTPMFLDLLAKEGVKATFCQVGEMVGYHPEITRQVVDEGHQLCNHGMTHDETMRGAPQAQLDEEIGGGAKAFTDLGLEPASYFRPPGGFLSDEITATAKALGEVQLFWAIDAEDWKTGAEAGDVVAHILDEVEPGSIILMHDGGGSSRATSYVALNYVIKLLKAEGYSFVFPVIDPA